MFGRYKPHLKLATASIFILISLFCYGQKTRVIGKTINGKTNEPIPFVNIYFNGSSIGTASDSLGIFELNNVPIEYSELIASAIGFETLSAQLQLVENKPAVVEFKMIPDAILLSSIVIRDKRNRKWERLYNDFCHHFIGETPNAKQTTIINPEVLDFKFNPSSKTLTAFASEPVVLENLALGFQISIVLEAFEASDKHYLIQHKSYFKPITPKNELQALQWQKKRIETYRGSRQHFLVSLIKRKHTQQGFTVQKSSVNPFTDINEFNQNSNFGNYSSSLRMEDLVSDSTDSYFRVLEPGIFKISYQSNVEDLNVESTTSWIEVIDPYLTVDHKGIIKLPANFWVLGHFEKLRLADQLPLDYDFWTEEKSLSRRSAAGQGSILGWVRDENENALNGATIFINNGLTQTKSNHWGQFQFDKLPSGEYPIVITHPMMQPILKIIPIDTFNLAEVVINMKAKESDLTEYSPINRSLEKQLMRTIHPRHKALQLCIDNPKDLYFRNDGKATTIVLEKPLNVSSQKLGYQWTLFDDSIILDKDQMIRLNYIKLDTIQAKDDQEKKNWISNRRIAYQGTWNQFVSSLIDGKLLDSKIEVYDYSLKQKKDATYYDSLVELKNGKIQLNLQNKTEVRFMATGISKRFKSIILEPKNSKIQISPSGVFNPLKLVVTLPKAGVLPLIPIDHTILKKEIAKVNGDVLVEKIHLHTDKPYYYPGDTIWFKGYVKSEFKTESELTSKVLYVDLLNEKGIVVRSLTLPIEIGLTNGDLSLSEELPRGDYILRAYTKYSAAYQHFYFKPIPVLLLNELIEPNEGEKSTTHPELSVRLLKEKEEYQLGDTIRLSLEVKENGKIESGECSVAVTDQLSVGTIESAYLNRLPFSEVTVNQPIGNQIIPEQGLTHNFKVIDGEPDKVYSLIVLNNKNTSSASVTFKGVVGSFVFNFTDSTTLFLKCTDSNNREVEVEFLKYEMPTTLLPEPLQYQVKKGVPRSNLMAYTFSDSVSLLLDEVAIKAKRIVSQEKTAKSVEAALGNVYSSLTDRQLLNIRRTKDLIEELHIAIPQLNNPLIRFQLFVNGRSEEPTILTSFPANQISRVDVYPRPMNAVAIYTESMIPYEGKNPNVYKLMGFSKRHKFYGGNSDFNNYRSTVYWNPTIKVEAGIGMVHFPTSKSAGTYKVVIEGLTDKGKFFRTVDYLRIVQK